MISTFALSKSNLLHLAHANKHISGINKLSDVFLTSQLAQNNLNFAVFHFLCFLVRIIV